jgi:hypothetical protein
MLNVDRHFFFGIYLFLEYSALSIAEIALLPACLRISFHSLNLPSCVDRDGKITLTIL